MGVTQQKGCVHWENLAHWDKSGRVGIPFTPFLWCVSHLNGCVYSDGPGTSACIPNVLKCHCKNEDCTAYKIPNS